MPRNILEQFRRIANFYFLLISVAMIVGYNTNLCVRAGVLGNFVCVDDVCEHATCNGVSVASFVIMNSRCLTISLDRS